MRSMCHIFPASSVRLTVIFEIGLRVSCPPPKSVGCLRLAFSSRVSLRCRAFVHVAPIPPSFRTSEAVLIQKFPAPFVRHRDAAGRRLIGARYPAVRYADEAGNRLRHPSPCDQQYQESRAQSCLTDDAVLPHRAIRECCIGRCLLRCRDVLRAAVRHLPAVPVRGESRSVPAGQRYPVTVVPTIVAVAHLALGV